MRIECDGLANVTTARDYTIRIMIVSLQQGWATLTIERVLEGQALEAANNASACFEVKDPSLKIEITF